MANKYLKSAAVIMNMQNKITPISLQIAHDVIAKKTIARLLLLKICISFLYVEPSWARLLVK